MGGGGRPEGDDREDVTSNNKNVENKVDIFIFDGAHVEGETAEDGAVGELGGAAESLLECRANPGQGR